MVTGAPDTTVAARIAWSSSCRDLHGSTRPGSSHEGSRGAIFDAETACRELAAEFVRARELTRTARSFPLVDQASDLRLERLLTLRLLPREAKYSTELGE
jgi:hypothetical protein